MLTNEDRAYWAGFFDADGCVSILRGKNRHVPSLMIIFAQVNGTVLTQGKDTFGLGHTNKQTYTGDNSPHCTWHNWYICNRKDAETFLRAIRDFSIAKRAQVELALEFIEFKKSHVRHGIRTPDDVLLKLLEYANKMGELNCNKGTRKRGGVTGKTK